MIFIFILHKCMIKVVKTMPSYKNQSITFSFITLIPNKNMIKVVKLYCVIEPKLWKDRKCTPCLLNKINIFIMSNHYNLLWYMKSECKIYTQLPQQIELPIIRETQVYKYIEYDYQYNLFTLQKLYSFISVLCLHTIKQIRISTVMKIMLLYLYAIFILSMQCDATMLHNHTYYKIIYTREPVNISYSWCKCNYKKNDDALNMHSIY